MRHPDFVHQIEARPAGSGRNLFALPQKIVPIKKFLSAATLFFVVFAAQAQSTLAFYTTLPQFGSGESTILYLNGNELFGGFAMSDYWLISVEFSASANDPAASLSLLGPVDSVYPPFDGFPGGESITYSGDFTLDESQIGQLLAGQAQIKIVQDLFSTDPDFSPLTFQGTLLPTPEPSTWAFLAAGAATLFFRRKGR